MCFQALKAVSEKDRVAVYNAYISHVTQYFGVTQTRPIYESAVASLPDLAAKGMCLRYAELERKLGEIDRARALYQHASQFSDPRSDTDFWEKWQEFEVQHGNEETYKEMRRLKRSVQLQFTQMQLMQTNIDLGSSSAPTFVAAGDIQGGAGTFHGEAPAATDAIAALESQGAESIALPIAKKPKAAAAAVPDANEIVRMLFPQCFFLFVTPFQLIDDLGIVEMAVPDAVFGALKGASSKVTVACTALIAKHRC
jgi:pre-mRNA-splicing factor SYF1